jgi:hypothetical protein
MGFFRRLDTVKPRHRNMAVKPGQACKSNAISNNGGPYLGSVTPGRSKISWESPSSRAAGVTMLRSASAIRVPA